jgi:hypothetical protein
MRFIRNARCRDERAGARAPARAPLLDAMTPALARPPRRSAGSASSTCRTASSWTLDAVTTVGADFELKTILEPLRRTATRS